MNWEDIGKEINYDRRTVSRKLPKPSKPKEIHVESKQFLVVIEFDLLAYIKKYDSKAIKKTFIIPKWLNERALEQGINFLQA